MAFTPASHLSATSAPNFHCTAHYIETRCPTPLQSPLPCASAQPVPVPGFPSFPESHPSTPHSLPYSPPLYHVFLPHVLGRPAWSKPSPV